MSITKDQPKSKKLSRGLSPYEDYLQCAPIINISSSITYQSSLKSLPKHLKTSVSRVLDDKENQQAKKELNFYRPKHRRQLSIPDNVENKIGMIKIRPKNKLSKGSIGQTGRTESVRESKDLQNLSKNVQIY
jgi:hypothetical protein